MNATPGSDGLARAPARHDAARGEHSTEPVPDRLREERLTIEDLLGSAREAGFGHLGEIALGVLEADGKFSFVPRRNEESLGAPDHIGG